jgi:glyoxylase-like metal-dependent hydrolase (beta-lactamase superfamily II)
VIEVASFTVGPVQENSYLVRRQGADSAVIFDPGDEADRLLAGIEQLGVRLEAILLTHTHFDHVGAVAPLAKATGAEVWCPELERDVLLDIQRWVPWPGFGPFENWDPEHTVRGGERLTIAELDFDVIFTPGHSPGHVTWSIGEAQALFSGDVLFQSSIGRTDLPFGDHQTLLRSIAGLLDAFPDETVVHPGHMGITTLGAERATNPFLQDLVA